MNSGIITLMEDIVELYVLRDPGTNEIRYAGKANDAAKRLKSHLRDSRRRNTPVYCWIRALAKSAAIPVLEVVQRVPRPEWEDAERALIIQLRAEGARLLNVAEGGDEPHCSPEVRAANGRKVALARAEDPIAAFIHEAKRRLGTALRQGHVNESTKAKMRAAAAKRPDLFGAWANIV